MVENDSRRWVCTEETMLDGTYAIQRPFIMVLCSDVKQSDAASAFNQIDFLETVETSQHLNF